MMKIQKKMTALPAKPHYTASKPFFSPKEIIFRGEKRAMVFKLSSKFQLFLLISFMFFCGWGLYSSHMYHRSDTIINKKEEQLDKTRVAYEDLLTEFAALNKSIENIMQGLGKEENVSKKKANAYKNQAAMIESRVNKITQEHSWLSADKVQERTSLYEAQLQRDLLASERDELQERLASLNEQYEELREYQKDAYDKVISTSGKEVAKMKKVLSDVNKALKEKGQYFNALSNRKDMGGPYIPSKKEMEEDKELNDKLTSLYQNMEDLDYYTQVIETTPLGKPVWSYWVTSKFGTRLDPFKKSKATHKGVDLASMSGNKLRVQAKGNVTRAEYTSGYGNLVEVDHGNGFKTRYAHMKTIYVQKGEELEKNTAVGEVGSTGRSTGPHLHYEVIYRGVRVDPMPFMQAKL